MSDFDPGKGPIPDRPRETPTNLQHKRSSPNVIRPGGIFIPEIECAQTVYE